MPLSWNDIKSRALAFSQRWHDACNEDSEAKPFLIDFFEVFGITNKRLATFELAVKKFGGKQGFVDLFWRGVLLVEMKSRGKNLDRAFDQAMGYFEGIKESDLPRYVLVCDFANFALTDLETNETLVFKLEELHQQVTSFGFIAGYTTQIIQPQDPINIKAAEQMGKLHDQLKAIGYDGHALEVYLVRLLFCLFAEDTGIFYERRQFQDYIENKTKEDGSDLAHHLATLFYILNTPPDKRLKNFDEDLVTFPYINGKLFEEILPPASFDREMRDALLSACALDWSRISPAIFGSLFQSIMDKDARRNLGAHYTSEENILKLIKPLFLDDLWAELEKIGSNKAKLQAFHERLASLNFFDPACGCGNFLVITYREIRKLELEVLKRLHQKAQKILDVSAIIQVDVNQFYGIEIEEFPAQIAQVALWLTDHQMNQQASEQFGQYFARIPLKKSANILHANALQTDWNTHCPNASYIIGNPPFIGAKFMSEAQRKDSALVFTGINNSGLLDFVCAWHVKSTYYMQSHTQAQTALVSTNSISQGEQVGVLWSWMISQGIHINFAHRTFSWTNEAKGKAAVHVVIIGFALQEKLNKTLFIYDDIKGEPHAIPAKSINPYLVDAATILIERRSVPISNTEQLVRGSIPYDDGHLILDKLEKDKLLQQNPELEPYIRAYGAANELINNSWRYCFWLKDVNPEIIRKSKVLMDVVDRVLKFRLNSKGQSVKSKADKPALFGDIRQPEGENYLLIPRVSSEKRLFIPIGFVNQATILGDSAYGLAKATTYHFGILTSTMHNAWMRTVAGRLKSDYRYSANLVYNNFPWAEPTDKQIQAIEQSAQAVLDARAQFPDASLADLYDPRSMPPDLAKAHAKLDKAVDTAYGYKGTNNDNERVAFLFDLYQKMTSLLGVSGEGKVKKTRKKG